MSNDDLDEFEPDGTIPVEIFPESQRMIVVKLLACGDIHAEDSEGQMIICREDGTVTTLLHGDRDWVQGDMPGVDINNISQVAWDIIGFHLGLTDGLTMGRSRDGRLHS